MCATVVINFPVGTCDQVGAIELGERIDRHCRWSVSPADVTLNLMTGVALPII